MPEIPVGAQIFDVVFHPTHSVVYTGLLTGHVNAYAYDEQGYHEPTFSVRPSKRSCRGLSIDPDGTHLYAVGKSKALNIIDLRTTEIETRAKAHESPINRIKYLMPWLLATGDDEGVIKLWDPRQRGCTRTYTQHFDYVTDFLWLDDKKHLVATSGDGTLSVMDVRSRKPNPFAQSEDQEDELLSIVTIKGGTKIVVGTQIGVLSIFNRSSGWADCVDRVPGHPHSIDALCALPESLPNVDTSGTILTGSSDGFVRAVQLFPTKLLGVVADHGEMPVERIAIGGGAIQVTLGGRGISGEPEDIVSKVGQKSEDEDATSSRSQGHGRWWVGSVGHEDILRLTDLGAAFEPTDKDEQDEAGHLGIALEESDDWEGSNEDDEKGEPETVSLADMGKAEEDVDSDDSEAPKPKKRKRKPEKNPLDVKKKKGKNQVEIEGGFFSEL